MSLIRLWNFFDVSWSTFAAQYSSDWQVIGTFTKVSVTIHLCTGFANSLYYGPVNCERCLTSQMSSIGWEHGVFGGQDINLSSLSCSSNHCSTILAWWHGQLSLWKMQSPWGKASRNYVQQCALHGVFRNTCACTGIVLCLQICSTDRESVQPTRSVLRHGLPKPCRLQYLSIDAHDSRTLTANQLRRFRDAFHINEYDV